MNLRTSIFLSISVALCGCAISDEPAFGTGGLEDGSSGGEEAPGGEAGGEGGGAEGGAEGGEEGGEEGGDDGGRGLPTAADGVLSLPCGEATGSPTFRYTELTLTDPPELAGLLGLLMKGDIDQGILNILIELQGLIEGGDTFKVLGGGAAVCEGAAGGYTWDTQTPGARPSDPLDATLDGDRRFTVGGDDAVLYFPITLLNASVRLDRLRVEGTLVVNEEQITDGKLSGYIMRSTADELLLPDTLGAALSGKPLTDILPETRIEDCGGEDCWLLAAGFVAEAVTQHAGAE